MSTQPLDLSQPHDVGALINTTFAIYARHFGLFAALAFGTVLVVETVVFGVGGGWLWKSYDDHSESAGLVALEWLLPILVLTPLITATHVRAVAMLGEGRVPTVGEALRQGWASSARWCWSSCCSPSDQRWDCCCS
jgi:hypothetical protein